MAEEIFLASHNAKKVGEMERILAEHLPGVRVLGADEVPEYVEPVEDQPTFEGNASAQGSGRAVCLRPAHGRR